MRTGAAVSGTLHVGFIGMALLSGQLLSSEKVDAIQVSDVSIMTEAEFSAAFSSAPEAPRTDIAPPVQPTQDQTETIVPDPDAAPEAAEKDVPETPDDPDADPDVTGIRAQPEADVDFSAADVAPEAPSSPEGVSLQTPNVEGPVTDTPESRSKLAMATPSQPRLAPRIDTTPAEKPPESAEKAKEATPERSPEPSDSKPEEQEPEKAPEASTSEITPDAKEENKGLSISGRPKRRPADIAERAAQAKATKQAAKPAAKPSEKTAESPKKAASQTSAPVGPPLSYGEKDGLKIAIQRCWNVPAGVARAEDLAVTLSAELDVQGKVVSNPKLVSPSLGSRPEIKQAYEAARRAILRCQPYSLPKEKFARWRFIEVLFNPRKMVVK